MFAAPVAGDHIGRNRPGTAGKAAEGNLGRQGVRHPAHGLDDRIETFRTRHETLDTDAGQWRRKPGSLARPEAQLLPKRMGDHQYVGKQDGAVKGKTSERLKRQLGRSEEHTSELQSIMRI